MGSDAVGTERVSQVVGYKIAKGNFSTLSPNLPQRIAILAEANSDNQEDLSTDPVQITSAQQAGQLFGYGSPFYAICRILFPISGGGIGGIPVIAYPQEEAVGASSKIFTITPTGTATKNGTHTIKVAGRTGLDGTFYDINVEEGDTTSDLTAKISDSMNNNLGCPFVVTENDYEATAESKWKGKTADDLKLSIDTGGEDLGISYVIESAQDGAGTPSIATALAAFGSEWNTIVINSYGTVTNILLALEQFNGIPDPNTPTGRYTGIIMKPFIALTGSVAEDPSSITDSRADDVTIAICPAPLSDGLPMEAAANMAVLFGRQAQDTPHLDVANRSYPDMPTPESIGLMAEYNERDRIVKKGCSTVSLNNKRYVVEDFVTSYHPEGEIPPQFRYCRNLMIDFNVRFGYYLLEQDNVVGHAIADDNDIVTASKVIKPKQWKQILSAYAESLAKRALVVQASFMQDSIQVNVGTSNPDRLETEFSYKRSGFGRILSTTATAGFNFGTV
jgi:phage tail sheath gpL-like